ncbi:MAG TPA: hypothetical protein VM677_20995 [Actinokineospora sp.]|jgi:hypothetical protein|nr:hypothetical protein [Actinokineospora sp.]
MSPLRIARRAVLVSAFAIVIPTSIAHAGPADVSVAAKSSAAVPSVSVLADTPWG